ncbi:DUF5998 family protein [Aeromicrobium fastidiosum]|uniref:Phosphodiesterase n=1 Tax=Aeromicrobium fastidiosum TaxID=52699 RepID=A0A641ANC6_9ACTN|nr:DUF5998 family protein [Aeromicrobium fastidiosum]KAA1378774.1 phosphodiesterase [Aeromicrobium fastidiosum]MBP2392232.1 hypothetical protein [Aeromicrobium fastidiosum]
MTADHTASLFEEVSRSGYYPEIVAAGLRDALADEVVGGFVLHHEPTFDRDEIRRHMTVLALTPSRLILVHTDEHPGDDLLPDPYTSTTSEAVALDQVRSVVVTRMVSSSSKNLEEALLTIGWGAVSRVELEPARCADPECEADHGYSGSVTGDDFSLRLAAAGDGGAAVERLLTFARTLSAATSGRV